MSLSLSPLPAETALCSFDASNFSKLLWLKPVLCWCLRQTPAQAQKLRLFAWQSPDFEPNPSLTLGNVNCAVKAPKCCSPCIQRNMILFVAAFLHEFGDLFHSISGCNSGPGTTEGVFCHWIFCCCWSGGLEKLQTKILDGAITVEPRQQFGTARRLKSTGNSFGPSEFAKQIPASQAQRAWTLFLLT